MLSGRNYTTEPAVHSNFDERLYAVKTAARERVFGQYGLSDLFREHPVQPQGADAFEILGGAVQAGRNAPRNPWRQAPAAAWRAAANSMEQAGGLAGLRQGAKETARRFGHHIVESGREAVFGSPITVGKQLQDRYAQTGSLAKTLGHHVKDHYWSGHAPAWAKALAIGMPALELGNIALNGKPEQRGGDLAHALTGLAAAPFTSRLGLPGMALQRLVQGGGRMVGSKFDAMRAARRPQAPARQFLPHNPASTPYTTYGS